MTSINKPVAAAVLLIALGLALLASSGLFTPSPVGAKLPMTNAHFLERTGAGLAFLLAYLCYFFSRKP
jgi:hypothetical protein